MVLVEEVIINMRHRVITTPVMPANRVTATYRPPSGFCKIHTHKHTLLVGSQMRDYLFIKCLANRPIGIFIPLFHNPNHPSQSEINLEQIFLNLKLSYMVERS